MPPRDHRHFASSPGPLRDKYELVVDADDILIPTGFLCQAGSAGDIVYRTLFGTTDVTEMGLMAGDVIGFSDHPVLLQHVRGNTGGTSLTSVVIGIV